MAVVIVTISCLMWVAALALTMSRRQMLAPVVSYLALLVISFAEDAARYQLLPVNGVILTGWLAMTLVVTAVTVLQPQVLQAQRRGTAYITAGAVTGMALGLSAFSCGIAEHLLYSIMVLLTAIGAFAGMLFFSRTPKGEDVALHTGRFFRYLLAKGFPTVITVAMAGVAALLALAVSREIQ